MATAAASSVQAEALAVLKTVFGYPAFRGQQADVVAHVASGNNALVLMPTGGGKSLCYQVPALVRSGVTVVISPLIALMQDQVAALLRKGVRAALLNSTLDRDETARVENEVRRGEIKLLYLSPERLMTDRCQRLLEASPLALFAIDEAHCISEWGHDFRPEYLQLSVLHERFPHVPRIALTATADLQTRAEIAERLGLTDARVFLSSFDRPNITYGIVDKHRTHRQLLAFIQARYLGAAGVVYCSSRARVERTAAFLDASGIPALPYHAGLSPREREENQAWFIEQPGVVMVATIAFGMGIDKPNVRFVAHVDVPKSVESYYQETGRAGRDGLPSEVWMAYREADATALYDRIRRADVSERRRRAQIAKLDAMLALCETAECRRVRLLAYFGEVSEPCGQCDTCARPPLSFDGNHAVSRVLMQVYRTGQRHNASQVAEALGGRAEKWKATIRQCVALGILAVDHEGDGALSRTPVSAAVLRGEQRVVLRRWRPTARPKARKRRARMRGDPMLARAALARLVAWRTEEAARRGVPVHVVLHDAALIEIAQRQPQTRWGLRWIPGVGSRRVELYGAALIRLVRK